MRRQVNLAQERRESADDPEHRQHEQHSGGPAQVRREEFVHEQHGDHEHTSSAAAVQKLIDQLANLRRRSRW